MVDGIINKPWRKRIIIQASVAIVIFISGIIVGAGGTILLLENRGLLLPPRPQHPPRMMASEIAEEIGIDYHLSDDQILQIKQIFEISGQSLEILRQDFDRKMEAGREEIRTAIKKVLPPEKFEQWQRDFDIRRGPRRPERFAPPDYPKVHPEHRPNGP